MFHRLIFRILAPGAAVVGVGIPSVTALDTVMARQSGPAVAIVAQIETTLASFVPGPTAARAPAAAASGLDLNQAGIGSSSGVGMRAGGNTLPDAIEPIRDVRGAEIARANQLAAEIDAANDSDPSTVENQMSDFLAATDFDLSAFASLPGSGSPFAPGADEGDEAAPPETGPSGGAIGTPPSAPVGDDDSSASGGKGSEPMTDVTERPPSPSQPLLATQEPFDVGAPPAGFAPGTIDGGPRELDSGDPKEETGPARDDQPGQGAIAVPEPAMIGLFSLATLALGARRRRRR